MKQSGTVLARGTLSCQPRVIGEHFPKGLRIAADNGIRGGFECGDRRAAAAQFLQMARKLLPACEAVQTRNEKLCPGQRAPGDMFRRLLELVPALLDFFR